MASLIDGIRGTPAAKLRRLFVRSNLHVAAREGFDAVFSRIGKISSSLSSLIKRAGGLSLEINRGVQLGPEELSNVLERSIAIAERMGDELKAIQLNLGDPAGEVAVQPITWLGEDLEARKTRALLASHQALIEVDQSLPHTASKESAEKIVAANLFKYFGACALKAYDVAEDGSVRVAHAFVPEEGQAVRIERDKVQSHFKDWVPPEQYIGEAMWDIVVKGESYVLIVDAKKDQRCWKTGKDGEVQVLESKPFAFIGEKISEKVTRVYKVDWENAEDLLAFGGISVESVFRRLIDAKRNIERQKEEEFLEKISRIAIGEKDMKAALGKISEEIAAFFRQNGRGSVADRVTIMLHDPFTDSLVTQVTWTPEGIQALEEKDYYYCGPKDQGIGRRIFDADATVSLRRVKDWNKEHVEWRRDRKGSLIGTIVKGESRKLGVVIVSSSREDAFTQGNVNTLERISGRVGPAFEKVAHHLAELYLDSKFGTPRFGSIRVYNANYLSRKLDGAIRIASAEETPLSVIYMDLDSFSHLNNAWIHADVDYVLAEIFSLIVGAKREGEVCRHGGEEIAVIVPLPLETAAIIAERIRSAIDKPIKVMIPYPSRVEAARAKEQILEKQKNWPNHGIKQVEVVERRKGEFFLAVEVHKTVSVGVAGYEEGDTPQSLLNRADSAQQDAKRAGKNRVVVVPLKASE